MPIVSPLHSLQLPLGREQERGQDPEPGELDVTMDKPSCHKLLLCLSFPPAIGG